MYDLLMYLGERGNIELNYEHVRRIPIKTYILNFFGVLSREKK